MALGDNKGSWFSLSWVFSVPSWINFFNISSWKSFFNSKPEILTHHSAETKALILRAMRKKSSIDELSFWWYSLSLWEKITSAALLIAASAFVGFLTSAPWLLTLATSIMTFFLQGILVTHEQNRQKMIKDLSGEAVELREQLGEEVSSLQANIAQLEEKLKELDQAKAGMEAGLALLEARKQSLKEENAKIKEFISTATAESEATRVVLAEIRKQREEEEAELNAGHDGSMRKVYSVSGGKTTFFALSSASDADLSYLERAKAMIEETNTLFEEIEGRQKGLGC